MLQDAQGRVPVRHGPCKQDHSFLENDMTEDKQTSERLGQPDTKAHDKMQGDKLNSGAKPEQSGTGTQHQDESEKQLPDNQAGGGV